MSHDYLHISVERFDSLSSCGHLAAADLRHIGVGHGVRGAAWGVRLCVNCGSALSGPGAMAAGPATAWYWHCRACAELVADQMDLVLDRPE